MVKKRVLSGIRATGKLHIGNYFGAVKGMLELQNDERYETLYMVADLHTITTPYDVEKLKKNRREILIEYLAAGLDSEKSIIFNQSDVKEHAELAFYLSTAVTISRMQHLPTYKEKVKQYPKENTMALLNYPILMASDILLYKAEYVPVGIDQEPHLEVAREIAKKMNNVYKTDFPEPQRFSSGGDYIPSLTGEGKMSKTVEGSYVNLTDSLEEIEKKIAKIPTDSGKGSLNKISGGVLTLFKLVELFQGPEKKSELEKLYENQGIKYGEVKKALAKAIYEELLPFQAKRNELIKDDRFIDEVIKQGAEKARVIAKKTIDEVKQKMGFSL
ncbi:tryptophan--tRNA ligase [Candidatus Roizmanbacteria bacterium RIFCSPHIGHO2_12_FULL_33_9]|uniref:Tryptophan--tRNA ligase n=1 Tax=Candidatus Roizmanbacteria bacterium RIFCSPHIGHO2_12_FULL_33_9 TaxID=1802045 RepID=A0A1F7HJ04_9BACT|nr:MAG: tryptophan--tRNA ligase [Candidatus Roizmanbacteria bacterium RIFCSPHIGHO2_12_FULL_33_9]